MMFLGTLNIAKPAFLQGKSIIFTLNQILLNDHFSKIYERNRKTQIARLNSKKVSCIRKKTFYLQFCMGAPEGHQKSIFNTSKVKKKNKFKYGIYLTKFASSTQKHKKVIEIPNQPIELKKNPQIKVSLVLQK
jgi:hypothetical protein